MRRVIKYYTGRDVNETKTATVVNEISPMDVPAVEVVPETVVGEDQAATIETVEEVVAEHVSEPIVEELKETKPSKKKKAAVETTEA